MYEPFFANISYSNNTAKVYGNNVAAVPKTLVQVTKPIIDDYTFDNLGGPSYTSRVNLSNQTNVHSGVLISFYFILIDKYGQIYKADNSSSLQIK